MADVKPDPSVETEKREYAHNENTSVGSHGDGDYDRECMFCARAKSSAPSNNTLQPRTSCTSPPRMSTPSSPTRSPAFPMPSSRRCACIPSLLQRRPDLLLGRSRSHTRMGCLTTLISSARVLSSLRTPSVSLQFRPLWHVTNSDSFH